MLKFTLTDDGTMDTVIDVQCTECGDSWTERIDSETAAEYRCDDGMLRDLAALMDEFDIACECTEYHG